jgi:hypothetical protein
MKILEILKFLFTEDEPKPIEGIEEKRKAVERFCAAQHHSCGRCNIAMKVAMGDYCMLTDEDVERTYRLIYGTADPKIINGGDYNGT